MQLFSMRSIAGAGEHTVGRAGVDLLCAAYLADSLGCAAEGTGGVDDVVKQDAGLAFDIADDVHDLGLVGLFAALVDDGHVDAELAWRKRARARCCRRRERRP